MKRTVLSVLMVLVTASTLVRCASTKILIQEEYVTEQLPRPTCIWVNNFVVTPADIPANSVLAGHYPELTAHQTAEHIATGRNLSAQIERELVERLQNMGMTAQHSVPGTIPRNNDIVIQGHLLSFAKGSAVGRVTIGLGYGSSELKVAVEGFQMTTNGLRKLWFNTSEAGGSKAPGEGLGIASFLATHNPFGFIIGSGIKVYNEMSGSSKVKGRAKQTAKEIAGELKKLFKKQGWIK